MMSRKLLALLASLAAFACLLSVDFGRLLKTTQSHSSLAEKLSLRHEHGSLDESGPLIFDRMLRGVSKRLFYQWKVPELFRRIPNPPRRSKAIVIGSGFGGSVAALRLAEAGIQTTVLERGQYWPISRTRDIHTYEPLRDGRGLWQRTSARNPIVTPPNFSIDVPVDKFGGVLDATEYENIEVWRGACVGGGSKVFTGVMIQPPQEYFEAIFGDTVSFEELDEVYYPLVKDKLRLSPVPDDIYQSKYYSHSRRWDERAQNAGYTLERPDSIFNWDVLRAELDGSSKKSALIGMSTMGNSNGAKFDTTQNYLKDARATGFVKVYPNQQVTAIRDTKDGYEVDIEKLDPFGDVVDRYSIEGESLFLAAGSIGTSELLVKAKAKKDISGLNSEIGKGWGTNGDTTNWWLEISDLPSPQGAACTTRILDRDGPVPVTFEAWYNPFPDIGVQPSLGIALDLENRGSFKYDKRKDKVDLLWPEDGNNVAEAAAIRVNEAIGSGQTGVGTYAGATAHPLGGAVIGKATDAYGRVKHGLYVVDGALVPGSTGTANPALTIAALAERNMEVIIDEDF